MKVTLECAVDKDGAVSPVRSFTVTAEEGIPVETLEALKRAVYRR